MAESCDAPSPQGENFSRPLFDGDRHRHRLTLGMLKAYQLIKLQGDGFWSLLTIDLKVMLGADPVTLNPARNAISMQFEFFGGGALGGAPRKIAKDPLQIAS